MKAIIEVARKGSIFRTAAQQLANSRQGRTPDFRLSFEHISADWDQGFPELRFAKITAQ